MTATYLRQGRGKSLNAYHAEQNGVYPLTTAVKIVYNQLKDYYKITQKTIRKWLEIQGPSEWHHVGKYATKCDYYDTEPIVDVLIYGNYDEYSGFLDDCELYHVNTLLS